MEAAGGNATDTSQLPVPNSNPIAAPVSTPTAPSAMEGQSNAPSLTPTRPPYIPQFTAATQMILKRMKREPSTSESPLAGSSFDLRPPTYEDVKRRLVLGMSTTASMTMEMPAATQSSTQYADTLATQPSTSTLTSPSGRGMSAIRRISSGLSASGKPLSTKPAPAKAASNASGKTKGTKRKRGANTVLDDGESSSLSSIPDLSGEEGTKEATPATPVTTMTKSGRQVQKPSTYTPATMSEPRKRAHHGKARAPEHALCKRCTRMHSPTTNQMVFCDGCNEGWHQRCHDPWIDDALVRDVSRAWFCASCQAKRERQPAKRQRPASAAAAAAAVPSRGSWASGTPQQKRAYLSTLSQQDLVGLVMDVLVTHPDLPIFPVAEEETSTGESAEVVSSARAELEGQSPSVRKASTSGAGPSPPSKGAKGVSGATSPKGQKNGGGGGGGATPHHQQPNEAQASPQAQLGHSPDHDNDNSHNDNSHNDKEQSKPRDDTGDDDGDFDPLAPPWPKPGKGLYSLLPPDQDDDEHLVDGDDYGTFSVVVYDEHGRKVEENGVRVEN